MQWLESQGRLFAPLTEADIDTLAQRLCAEARAGGGVSMPYPMVAAWARRPGAAA
ncbi:hypothetical protein OV208_34180 [Corallococcus sp. bb12-1]|uniref:hypothetical protein n=1 Tax=Corallococcus sp. bb12-1 TaxID=2996784 RepID=UPI00226FBF35|nr:hypothetical protein [Corallococcus sp. bb12-1]MCY1046403.1 hypothetical protein [Corallococcus sp. bb12-1]